MSSQAETTNHTPELAKRTTTKTIMDGLGVLYRSAIATTVFFASLALATPATAKPPVREERPKSPQSLTAAKKLRARAARPQSRVRRPARKSDRDLGAPYDRVCSGVEVLPRRKGKSPFGTGEELSYELSVAGAYVGRMETKVGRPRTVEGKQHLVLFGRARTNQLLTALQPFMGRYMSVIDPDSLDPLGVRTEVTYGGDERWEKIRFLDDKRGVRTDYFLKGQKLARTYKNAEHDLTDVLTLLFVARTIDLKPGLTVCQDVFGSRRLWRMTASMAGSERVKTPAGRMDAWVVKSVFDRKPTYGLSRTNRPRIEMDMFLAKDESQAPLRFVVRLKGVEAVGRLVRWSTKGRTAESEWGI